MASIDELVSAIQANIAAVNEAIAGATASGAVSDELTGSFAALNAEGQSQIMVSVKQQLEEAITIGGSMVTKLEEAQTTAESAKS